MDSTHRLSTAACVMLCASLLLAVTSVTRAQTTTTERAKGEVTVSALQVHGEVVQVEGNDLLVKLSTGELKTFRVPETRRFVIDGKELTVHDLQPGTTLTATVKTTATPMTVRTKTVLNGKVWYVGPPTVILTLPDGENKQYTVKHDDNVQFTMGDRKGTIFDLRKGMIVSAERIVEEPHVEITTDTTVVGHAPAAPVQTAASPPETAPEPTPEPAAAATSTPQPATSQPAEPVVPESVEPAAPQPAAPENATPAVPEPAAPQAEETGTSRMFWVFLIIVLIVAAVFAVRGLRRT